MNELKNSQPMYQQICSILEQQISEGVYKEGEKIPTEIQLMDKFGVSRTTVRLAMKEMTARNLVKKIPGKGTFVNKVSHNLEEFKVLYDSLIEVGIIPERKLLEYEKIRATDEMKHVLGLKEASEVLKITRLLHADQNPIAMVEILIHPKFTDLIIKEEVINNPVYQFLAKEKGLRVKQSDLEIFADNASKEAANILQINGNDAVISTKRVLYTDNGDPIEHVVLSFRADSYRFKVTLQGEIKLQLTDIGRYRLKLT